MKRFISILVIFSLAMSFCVQTAGAAMIGDTAQTRPDLASVFSDSLRERLAQAGDDDVIRVTIELTDDIDLDNIEMKAFSRAKISATEKASLVADVHSLTEAENKSVQLEALNVQDRISKNRNALLEEFYTAKNNEFISSTCLKDAKIGSVGIFTPFIRDIKLTKTEILEIAANSEVREIDLVNELSLGYFDEDNISTRSSIFQDIDDTYKLIGGNAAVDAGYTGSGIRVGVIELGNPDTTKMGSDGKNITCDNDDIIVNYHTTMVCGIIKKFAPSCSIYSKAISKYLTDDEIMDACSNLIRNYTLHVLNLSFGNFGGKYTKSVREMDYIIRSTKVPIVVAAGNAKTDERSLDDGEVEVEILDGRINILGMAANAITVGNALTVGTNPDALDAFTLADDSCYEETSPINKPDICAPEGSGTVRIGLAWEQD